MANPADATASPFGWHDADGVAGAPDFTITRGAAAHAYLDQDDNNAMDFDGSPEGGAGLDFDFPADLTQHAQRYRDAVVANLFYGNSVFHDIMHGFGFDEPAGNFQANNYGRGGTGATTSAPRLPTGAARTTPTSPRPWSRRRRAARPGCRCTSGPGTSSAPRTRWSSTAVGSFDAVWSRFGAAPTVAGTSGQLFNANNGCVAADYAGAAGKIVIVTGGSAGCQNVDKARRAGDERGDRDRVRPPGRHRPS